MSGAKRQESVAGRGRAAGPKPAAGAVVGVVEHGNSAVLVTLSAIGELLDRRSIDLTAGLPTHPYHHEGSWAVGRYLDSPWAKPTTLPDALAMVARVHEAAARGATEGLAVLAAAIPTPIDTIALRVCPPLPATAEARIRDTRAATIADSVMYRQALAAAAEARAWRVVWYDRDAVSDAAARAVGTADITARLASLGRTAGVPWQARHKLAATAALAASVL